MAFSTIIRRAASTVAPLAFRGIRNQRNYSSAIITPLKNSNSLISQELRRKTFHPSIQFFSSAVAKKSTTADEKLVRVIDTEIECAKESVTPVTEGEDIPAGFPFKIEDNPGEQTITLKREYQGEVIKVQVHMPDLVTGNEGEDDDDDDDEDGADGEKSSQSSIPLVVTVSKENGPSLEFNVMAYPDEISIDSLAVKQPESAEDQINYEGPEFTDLDENLQKAFHKYLEIRGIKPSTTNFLHEYMINKDSREYLKWLNNLKDFVQH